MFITIFIHYLKIFSDFDVWMCEYGKWISTKNLIKIEFADIRNILLLFMKYQILFMFKNTFLVSYVFKISILYFSYFHLSIYLSISFFLSS